jgi:arginase family enzyme
MKLRDQRRIALFGCPLDPDEREQYIQRKVRYVLSSKSLKRNCYMDPYDVIFGLITNFAKKSGLIFCGKGKVDVETWLTPFPLLSDLPLLNVPNFVAFIDTNGCQDYAAKVCEFTKTNILPDVPLLIGVDHSMTGGVLKALSEIYGKNNILAVFIDSHFDGISLPIKLGLIHYDIETNPKTIYRKNDPYIYDRADSYNTESFIKFLIKEQVILPENIVCIGISNYPPLKAFSLNDTRVKNYIREFTALQERGVTIIKKEDLRRDPTVLKNLFKNRDIEHLYVSVDMDIGANAATKGVRFSNGYIGLKTDEICKIISEIRNFALKKGSLIGMDLMEIDTYTADESTYTLALTIIEKLLAC